MNIKGISAIIVIILIIVGGIFLVGNDSGDLQNGSQAAVEESDEGAVGGEVEVVDSENEEVAEEESDDGESEEENGEQAEDGSAPTVVTYTDSGFDPDTVEIEAGQTVQWVNNSSRNLWVASAVHPTHTLYPEKKDSDCLGSSFDSCIGIASGESFEFTFNEIGSWNYHDHLSSGKWGTVDVN